MNTKFDYLALDNVLNCNGNDTKLSRADTKLSHFNHLSLKDRRRDIDILNGIHELCQMVGLG